MIKLYSIEHVGYECEACGKMFSEPVTIVLEDENMQFKACPYCGFKGEAEVYDAT